MGGLGHGCRVLGRRRLVFGSGLVVAQGGLNRVFLVLGNRLVMDWEWVAGAW